jgi:hypothetical protein
MARKQVKDVEATASEKSTRAVRLVLPSDDADRLEKVAKARGLNMASYARMAVLKLIKEDEEG